MHADGGRWNGESIGFHAHLADDHHLHAVALLEELQRLSQLQAARRPHAPSVPSVTSAVERCAVSLSVVLMLVLGVLEW